MICLKICALVDYSETGESSKASNRLTKEISSPAKKSESSLIWKSDIAIDMDYESIQIDHKKNGLMNFSAHLQTPVSVFVDAHYWQSTSAKSASGNSKILLGFNWMRLGNAGDEATINLFGGLQMANSKAGEIDSLASGRNDKIFGVETTKKFGVFGLGFLYDYTMTGRPNNTQDKILGSIHHFEVSGGWIVSPDIQFELSFENYRFTSSSDFANEALKHEFTYSTLSPKMNLQIFKGVNFTLGARYLAKKPILFDTISQLKIIDKHCSENSSVFTGLNISM